MTQLQVLTSRCWPLGETGQGGGGVALAQTNCEGAKADREDCEHLGSGLPRVGDMGGHDDDDDEDDITAEILL